MITENICSQETGEDKRRDHLENLETNVSITEKKNVVTIKRTISMR